MRSSSYRKELQEQRRSRFHAGMLTDPVEDSVRVRCHLVQKSDADISSVLFLSYHPDFNLILAWPTYEPMKCKDLGPDSILSDNQRVGLLQKRGKYVPTDTTAGVSSLFLSRGNVRAVYLDPERTHLVLDEPGWSTRDARRSSDPRMAHAVGIRDRVYLPLGPYANGGRGAFLVKKFLRTARR